MKKFASPGIDSHPLETGVYNSGAGQSPEYNSYARHGKIVDPSSRNPVWDKETGRMVGNFPATQAPTARSLRIRRRGMSPWGGYPLHVTSYYEGDAMDSILNVGGSVDHNAGASSLIAGGPGAASSMVRMNGVQRSNRGAKLPTLPQMIDRGGDNPLPSGGQRGTVAAPLIPEMLGLPSIIKISDAPGGTSPGGVYAPVTSDVLPRILPRNPKRGDKYYFDGAGNVFIRTQYLTDTNWAYSYTWSGSTWTKTVNPFYTNPYGGGDPLRGRR